MPNHYDGFNLVVRGSAEALVWTSNTETSSGAAFTMTFNYAGGFNPVATGFELHWFTTTAHQDEGILGQNQNALPANDSRIPTQIVISPTIPEPGATADSEGSVRGIAPTLGQSERSRTVYGVMTILQAALNV